MRRLATVLAVLAASGCQLYFDDSGDDVPCPERGYAPTWEFRNPIDGTCQGFGGGGCADACGVCAEPATGYAQPDWGACYSKCDAITETGATAQAQEAACLAEPECRAIYSDLDIAGPVFVACWAIAPSGPVHGSCHRLDAQDCSRHDDCSAVYTPTGARDTPPFQKFVQCIPEHSSCSGVDCGVGSHCEEQCYPCDDLDCPVPCRPMCVPDQKCDPNSCPTGSTCVEVCTTSDPNTGCGSCHVDCVPSTMCEAVPDESTCKSRSDCLPVYQGDDCTCVPGHCDCNILTYERCETAGG